VYTQLPHWIVSSKRSLVWLHATSALDHRFHEVSIVTTCNFRIGPSVPWEGLYCDYRQLPHWTISSMRRSPVWLHATSALDHQFNEKVQACALDNQFDEKVSTLSTHNLCTRRFHENVCTVTIHSLCIAQSASGLVIQCGCLNSEFRDAGFVLLLGKTGQENANVHSTTKLSDTGQETRDRTVLNLSLYRTELVAVHQQC
jgi:hypothetical protein